MGDGVRGGPGTKGVVSSEQQPRRSDRCGEAVNPASTNEITLDDRTVEPRTLDSFLPLDQGGGQTV